MEEQEYITLFAGNRKFRFTEILRSYIQAIWIILKIYWGLSINHFRKTTTTLLDFESEICMYQRTEEIVSVINGSVKQHCSVSDNLVNAYSSLERIGVVDQTELQLLDHWLKDITPFIFEDSVA